MERRTRPKRILPIFAGKIDAYSKLEENSDRYESENNDSERE